MFLDISEFPKSSSTLDEQRYTDTTLGCRGSSQTGRAGSSIILRGGASISARYGNPVKAAQGILCIPAVHTHAVSPSTTPYPPQRYLHQTRRHAINGWTSFLLVSMLEKVVPVRGPMTAQCAGMGNRLTLRHSARNPTQSLCGIAVGTPSSSLTLVTVGGADVSQVEFRLSAYFGKWWGGELADEIDGRFEREDRGVRAAWSAIFGHLRGWTAVGPQSCRAGWMERITAGYSGEGIVHAWMSVKELACMASGKDVDWLPARFAKVGKGKHRVARIYVGVSEQSVLRLRSSCFGAPSTTFYSHPTTEILLHRLMNSTSIIRCDRIIIPFVHLSITSIRRNALRSFIQDVAITTRNQ
ncbi:hypothetical protein EV421DRAFT_2029273 [Armillaria borealis]|uniref:Uncharacterized protein n=1 Tax=Armillaria borealis TaxID=47425 RepID=A0AA39N3I5_9AGAR|nr:hypothetical protein EV421DRAFT_2029273 [Armillaria borealis]